MMNGLNKLSLVSTRELLDEIMNRYDHSIFVACKDRNNEEGEVMFDRRGLYFAQVGLANYIMNRLDEREPRRKDTNESQS